MIIRKGITTDGWEHAEKWEKMFEFYTFQDNVGYNTEEFFVSMPERKSKEITRRFVQKKNDANFELRYSFWALTKWQPGLKVSILYLVNDRNESH